MKQRISWRISVTVVMTLAMILLAIGANASITRAGPGDDPVGGLADTALSANVSSSINFQGFLEIDGAPVTGSRSMTFNFHTASDCAGTPVDTYTNPAVSLVEGMFSEDVPVTQSLVNGQALYLEVIVNTTSLLCEEVIPVPYALGLRPGVNVQGTPNSSTGWVFKSELTGTYPSGSAILGTAATGYAVEGRSNGGFGLYGFTSEGYAVYGYDAGTLAARGYAGYFYSANGVGIRAKTDSTAHYSHAGIFEANYGWGIYATSTHNNAIRAIGGDPNDLSGVWQPSGTVALVGLSGSNRAIYGSSRDATAITGISSASHGVKGTSTAYYGVYGDSVDSSGVRGESDNSYGGSFYSTNYRGLQVSSDTGYWGATIENRGGNSNPGLRVYGTSDIYGDLWVGGDLTASGSKAGYVVDIVKNAGPEALETGDVVVLVGFDSPVLGEIPVLLVRKADTALDSAVIGVIDKPYAIPVVSASDGTDQRAGIQATADSASVDDQTAVAEEGYASMVTLGAFKAIKVDASYGAIAPGDILVSSPRPGYAMRSDDPTYGTIIGKAAGALESGTGLIPVMITLD